MFLTAIYDKLNSDYKVNVTQPIADNQLPKALPTTTPSHHQLGKYSPLKT